MPGQRAPADPIRLREVSRVSPAMTSNDVAKKSPPFGKGGVGISGRFSFFWKAGGGISFRKMKVEGIALKAVVAV